MDFCHVDIHPYFQPILLNMTSVSNHMRFMNLKNNQLASSSTSIVCFTYLSSFQCFLSKKTFTGANKGRVTKINKIN